jgi:hypothetical protein
MNSMMENSSQDLRLDENELIPIGKLESATDHRVTDECIVIQGHRSYLFRMVMVYKCLCRILSTALSSEILVC